MKKMGQNTDSELMSLAAHGDTTAFDWLIERYTDQIYAFILRFSGDQTIAEDATQEAFIKIWKNRKKFDAKKNFKSWLFTIARNAALDILRKRRDYSFSSMEGEDGENFAEDIIDERVDISGDFDAVVTNDILEKALKTLTPDQRAAVILHDIEGMTFDEAGEVIGKPLNTVKSYYRRAILALRKILVNGHNGM